MCRRVNCVIPKILIQQLRDLGLLSRILNFVNFHTTQRDLYFSSDQSALSVVDTGVPQGGVLAALLFNLYTSRILHHVGSNVKEGI